MDVTNCGQEFLFLPGIEHLRFSDKHTKTIPNPTENSRVHPKNRLKIDENRVQRHPRAPKSTNKGTESHFYQSFAAPGPSPHYDLEHFGLQKHMFSRYKNWPKNGSLQNHSFSVLFTISRASGARFSSILGPKSDPWRSFFKRFSGDRIYTRFLAFFVKKCVKKRSPENLLKNERRGSLLGPKIDENRAPKALEIARSLETI